MTAKEKIDRIMKLSRITVENGATEGEQEAARTAIRRISAKPTEPPPCPPPPSDFWRQQTQTHYAKQELNGANWLFDMLKGIGGKPA